MPRALITGIAGFIGSHLADRLIAEKWDVVGIDDLSAGNKAHVPPTVSLRIWTSM